MLWQRWHALRAVPLALPGFPVVLLVLRWPGRARYGVLCVGKKRVCPGVVTIDTSVQNHNHSETSSATLLCLLCISVSSKITFGLLFLECRSGVSSKLTLRKVDHVNDVSK